MQEGPAAERPGARLPDGPSLLGTTASSHADEAFRLLHSSAICMEFIWKHFSYSWCS